MTELKKQYNMLEKSILRNLRNAFPFISIVLNHTHGIDIKFYGKLNIEIKSCYRYISNGKNKYRYGLISFKQSELINTNFYIMIEKINKPFDLKYIKSMNIFIVNKEAILKILNNKDLTKRICITINKIKKLKTMVFSEFVNKLKEVIN